MQEEIVFEDYGIVIVRREGKLFARYDAGELVIQMTESPISETQALKAQQGERQAHEVLLAIQRLENTPTVNLSPVAAHSGSAKQKAATLGLVKLALLLLITITVIFLAAHAT